MRTVMLISDKVEDYNNFIEPLKLKYPVDPMGYIDSARMKLSKRPYSLIIIEIRMATLGEFSLEETQNGSITGIIWFKKELANLGVPVLFWSYSPDHEIEIEMLKEEFPNNKIGFIVRDNSDEEHLLKGVKEFFINKKNLKPWKKP